MKAKGHGFAKLFEFDNGSQVLIAKNQDEPKLDFSIYVVDLGAYTLTHTYPNFNTRDLLFEAVERGHAEVLLNDYLGSLS